MIRFLILATSVSLLATAAWAGGPARSFSHTVSTTAARVEPATGDKTYGAIRCWNAGASPVYVGGKDVNRREGYPICSNVAGREGGEHAEGGAKCPSGEIKLRTSDLYAVVSSGQQFLNCIAVGAD